MVYAAHFSELLHIATFLYCLLIRPIELMRLQRKHLDFKNKIVRIPGIASKTDFARHPKIAQVFFDFLIVNNYESLPPHFYLFGDMLKPAAKITLHEDRRKRMMENMHLKVCRMLRKIGIFFEVKQRMYSWKSTGAIDLFRAGVKMKFIQMQSGHTSIATTEIYLKSLGAMDPDYENELNEKQTSL